MDAGVGAGNAANSRTGSSAEPSCRCGPLAVTYVCVCVSADCAGNWYEDRLDLSKAPMPELERTGKFRQTPLKMTETTPADYVTSSQYFHCAQVPLVPPPQPQIVGKNTVHLALHTRQPPAEARPHGFGAVVPRHEPDHDRRRLDTTTHSVFGGKYADSQERRREGDTYMQGIQHTPAGKVSVTFTHAHARRQMHRSRALSDCAC